MKYNLKPARKITLEEAMRDVAKHQHTLDILAPIDGPYEDLHSNIPEDEKVRDEWGTLVGFKNTGDWKEETEKW